MHCTELKAHAILLLGQYRMFTVCIQSRKSPIPRGVRILKFWNTNQIRKAQKLFLNIESISNMSVSLKICKTGTHNSFYYTFKIN